MQMPATRWCLAIGTSTSCEWWAGAHVPFAQAIHELLLRLVWGLGEADAVDTAVLTPQCCVGG